MTVNVRDPTAHKARAGQKIAGQKINESMDQ